VHHAYSKNAEVTVPSLDDWEKQWQKNPQQITQKGLKGCKTTRQVTTFAQKHNVPWTWYKPTPNYRVMLVDWPGFRTAWITAKTMAPSEA